MAKFCRNCGNPLEEGAQVCSSCGAQLNAPAAPAAEENDSIDWKDVGNKIGSTAKSVGNKVSTAVKNLDTKRITKVYKSLIPIIAVVMAVLCLIIGIIQTFGTYDIEMKTTVNYDGDKETDTQDMSISEFYEAIEDAEYIQEQLGISVVGVLISNILYGLCNFFLAIILILPFFGLTKIKFVKKAFNNFSLIGFVSTLAYMILFAIFASGSTKMYGMKVNVSIGVHFTAWIAVILFAILTVFSHVLPRLNTKAAEAPAAESAE